jgi:hypothetical protein
LIFARAGARLRGTRPRAQGWHLGNTKREEQWPVRIYQTQNMWPVRAAAQRLLRRNLHERCARAGTEPAATLRSSIRARPPATAKASARACASFQRRNGEGIKLAPHSESSGETSRGNRQPRLADSTSARTEKSHMCSMDVQQRIKTPLLHALADLAPRRLEFPIRVV